MGVKSVGINSYAVGEAPHVRLRGQGAECNYNPILYPRRRLLGVCAHSVGIYSHAPNCNALYAHAPTAKITERPSQSANEPIYRNHG